MRDHDDVSTVEIRVAQAPEALRGQHPDPGLGAFFRYARSAPVRTFKTIELILKQEGKALLACLEGTVIGYVVISCFGPDQRWGRGRGVGMHEVTIEVAREWRGRGLARRLLAAALADPSVEELILIATAYRWCWDPQQPNPGSPDEETYSRRLFKLFDSAGFTRRMTNEPNVAMDPLNFLAVRIGAKVSPERVRRFETLLFTAQAA
jgi:GNAT superfamily N-acetyltransferase